MSWDLLDEDCADISDWVDEDTGNAESKVNPAGQFEFDSNTSAADNRHAVRNRDIGEYPNIFTIEVRLYHDAIGTQADYDGFVIECYQADENIRIYFNSDGLFIQDTGSGFTEVGTDLVKHGGSAEWQIWRFIVTFTGTTGEGTCDIYLQDSTHNKERVGTTIPCSREGAGTDGKTKLVQYGHTTDDRISHLDYIRIMTGGAYWQISTDILAFTDSLIGKAKKFLADTLTFTDAITKRAISRLIADTLAFTDVTIKKTKRVLADTIALTDSLIKKVKKKLADTLVFTDVVFKKTIKTVMADTLAFTDSIKKKTKKFLAGTIAFTDAMGPRTIKKVLSDGISFVAKFWFWVTKIKPSPDWTDTSKDDPSWTDTSKDDSDWEDVNKP